MGMLDVRTLEWVQARLLAAQSEIELSQEDGVEVSAAHTVAILLDEVQEKLAAGRQEGVGLPGED